jgi:hypothetical protein
MTLLVEAPPRKGETSGPAPDQNASKDHSDKEAEEVFSQRKRPDSGGIRSR